MGACGLPGCLPSFSVALKPTGFYSKPLKPKQHPIGVVKGIGLLNKSVKHGYAGTSRGIYAIADTPFVVYRPGKIVKNEMSRRQGAWRIGINPRYPLGIEQRNIISKWLKERQVVLGWPLLSSAPPQYATRARAVDALQAAYWEDNSSLKNEFGKLIW